jgi:hypothetical protein
MTRSNARFDNVLVDGQIITIPSSKTLQAIILHQIFLDVPVYSDITKKLVSDLILFALERKENFRLGMVQAKGMRSWTVLPLLLMEGRLQRVQIEHVTCGKCGKRLTIANPSEPSLYFGSPDELVATRAAWELPRVLCPDCGAALSRVAAWVELDKGSREND